jgi:hypothetical protein
MRDLQHYPLNMTSAYQGATGLLSAAFAQPLPYRIVIDTFLIYLLKSEVLFE